MHCLVNETAVVALGMCYCSTTTYRVVADVIGKVTNMILLSLNSVICHYYILMLQCAADDILAHMHALYQEFILCILSRSYIIFILL